MKRTHNQRKCDPKKRKFSCPEDFKNHLLSKPEFKNHGKRKYGVKNRHECPTEITEAALNEDIADAALDVRSYLQYHHRVGALVHGSLQGKPLSDEAQEKLVKDGQKMEGRFQDGLQKTFGAVTADNEFKKQIKEMSKYPEDMLVFSNPSLWDDKSVKAVKALGVSNEEMAFIYENYVIPLFDHEDFLDHQLLAKRGELITDQTENIIFPEAPEHLEQFLMVGANENPVEVVVGAVLATAGVIVAPFNPVAGGALIAAGAIMVVEGIVTDDGVLAPGSGGGSSNNSVSSSVQQQNINAHWQGVASNPPAPSISFTLAERAEQVYGYLIGNKNTKEAHTANCSYLHLIKPKNEVILDSANEARGKGYDNCHYCIGGSKR